MHIKENMSNLSLLFKWTLKAFLNIRKISICNQNVCCNLLLHYHPFIIFELFYFYAWRPFYIVLKVTEVQHIGHLTNTNTNTNKHMCYVLLMHLKSFLIFWNLNFVLLYFKGPRTSFCCEFLASPLFICRSMY